VSASKIFLAPRSNETSHKNFESTIVGGRKYSELEPYLDENERRVLSQYPTVSVWGNKENLKGRWSQMEPGDLVLFYANHVFYYSARVVLTKFDENLGKRLWPVDKDGKPWPCLFFVDNVTEINIPIQLVQELAEYADSWDRVQGFMRLNDRGTEAIKRKFGSLENFVSQEPEALEAIENILEETKSEIVEARPLETPDISRLLKVARDYRGSGPGYKESSSPRKVRVENREQKRRVAEIENRSCQICGWSLEWTSADGVHKYRIDIDHIIEKSDKGSEELDNLWALCPNCHAEKTSGVITLDLKSKKVYRFGKEISLHHDRHLFV
jgi:5-methylcytosine-specific restriction endonuclease McrA